MVAALEDQEVRQQLEAEMKEAPSDEWDKAIIAIHQILQGERDRESLCQDLHYLQSMIIYAILDGIANPETLKQFIEG